MLPYQEVWDIQNKEQKLFSNLDYSRHVLYNVSARFLVIMVTQVNTKKRLWFGTKNNQLVGELHTLS